LLEQVDRLAVTSGLKSELAETGERSCARAATEGVREQAPCLLGLAQAESELCIDERIADRCGDAARELVGIRAKSVGELSKELE
jgi:hypothetical protein